MAIPVTLAVSPGQSSADFLRPSGNAPSSSHLFPLPMLLLCAEELYSAFLCLSLLCGEPQKRLQHQLPFEHYVRVQVVHLNRTAWGGISVHTWCMKHLWFDRIRQYVIVQGIWNTFPSSLTFPFACWLYYLYTVLTYDLCYHRINSLDESLNCLWEVLQPMASLVFWIFHTFPLNLVYNGPGNRLGVLVKASCFG